MKSTILLTAAALALAVSSQAASAQFGGGGTIGCDPAAPSHLVSATNCRIFFKEALYGPSANPYASSWDHPAPVVRHKKVIRSKKSSSVHKSSTVN